MHLQQIKTRQDERVQAQRDAKRQHEEDMHNLKLRVAHNFEEHASRRSWHRQVATEQNEQLAEKVAAELAQHKDSHTALEYWPFEVDKPGMVVPDKKVYGAELLLAAQQKENAKALQKAMLRRSGPPTLRLRVEREAEQARLESATVGRVPPHEVKAALSEANRRRRETVAAQAAERLPAADPDGLMERQRGREVFPPGEQYITANLSRFQLKEAQRDIRENANKQQLRAVLAKQAAEKQTREAREHYETYGTQPDTTSGAINKLVGAAAREEHHHQEQLKLGVARRAELEEAILAKQRERRLLRKTMIDDQAKLDQDAAATEVLSYELDRLRQGEQRVKMQIEMAKYESVARKKAVQSRLVNHPDERPQ